MKINEYQANYDEVTHQLYSDSSLLVVVVNIVFAVFFFIVFEVVHIGFSYGQ